MPNQTQEKANAPFSQIASAAGTARSAIKTGKALASTAKGATAGPYGMLAAGLWENRKLIGKILAAASLLLLLPILFILMLPSMIFGNNGLDDAPEGVLNDTSLIIDNIAEAEQAIEEILMNKHDLLIEEIESVAEQLGEDTEYDITDEFADRIIFQSTLIISQYCAYRDGYKNIRLPDLKKLIEDNTDDIFTYRTEISTREIPRGDGEVDVNGNELTRTVTHYEYIIEYAGDSYFAEHVFRLSEDQLALATDYTGNLYLFLFDSLYTVETNPNLRPSKTGNEIVDLALTRLGTPYSQAKRNEPGYFDCSSFTYWVYDQFGINLSYGGSNTAAAQGRYITENNLAISYENLAPGDLIFYSFETNNRYLNISHVAIYCGNNYVVDASSSKKEVTYRPVYNKNRIVLCGRPAPK